MDRDMWQRANEDRVHRKRDEQEARKKRQKGQEECVEEGEEERRDGERGVT
jgi:hypothetical protein